VAQDLKWREDQRLPIFQRYLTLTEEAGRAAHEAHPHARIVVIWPETASPYLLAQDEQARRAIAAALPPNGVLLAGTVRADWGADGRLARVYNSLVGVGGDAALLTVFDKAHLVPFGEYMPLGGLLPIRMVTGGMDFTAGPGPASISLPGVPAFSPLICYEVIFPGHVVGAARPAWLLNVTNDAWFGLSAGPYQHLASARLRAVEEGLPMVRVAQTGISAVFDAQGRGLGWLGLGGRGSLTAWLPPAAAATAFSQLGLLIPGFFVVIALVASNFWRGRHKYMQEQI
jgi:apolipoprotein N-acyltransferase